MKIKHYIDIVELVKETTDDGLVRIERNDTAFLPGDTISITEKIDGSNASIRYDMESGKLAAFSRKQELDFSNTLDGFWNFVQTLDPAKYADTPQYSIFGEWNRKNKIIYAPEFVHKWYVYSIYDNDTETWLDQDTVKEFCHTHDLIYVHELYYGPFISWEHCESFMHSPAYGETQEGIVVRDITALKEQDTHPGFHVLKLVNKSFKERMKTRVKVVDPEKEKEKADAQALMEGIITRFRVEKMMFKLRDEQILPEKLTPADMGLIAKNLPKRIYEDCLKEDRETVVACGEYAGKLCGSIVMNYARAIVVGS